LVFDLGSLNLEMLRGKFLCSCFETSDRLCRLM